jgi:hypothetical protein
MSDNGPIGGGCFILILMVIAMVQCSENEAKAKDLEHKVVTLQMDLNAARQEAAAAKVQAHLDALKAATKQEVEKK